MTYKKIKYLFFLCFFFFVFLLSVEAQSSDSFTSVDTLKSTLLNIKDAQGFQKLFISFSSKTTLQNEEYFTILYPYYEMYYEAFDISAKPASVRFLFAFAKKTKLETKNAKLIASLQKYLYYLLSFQDTANTIYTDKALSLFIGFGLNEKDLIAAIIKESNDFKACLQFKILSDYVFTDVEIINLLDLKKPLLSAMVLDYRFGKNYPNFNYMVKVSPLVEDESVEAKLFKSKVQAFLLEALKTKQESLILAALKSLYALNDTNLLTQIIILCDSPFPLVRAYSFYGIHVYGDSRFVAACLKRLYDENNEVRKFAIQTLGRLRDGRAVDPLGKILLDKTEDPHIRTLAAKALGDIGDTRTTQIFKTILIDASSPFGARVAAAIFMGAKKEKSAVDALINALDPTTVSELNWACINSLGRIDDAQGKRKLAAIVSKALTKWTSNNFTFDHVANSLWVCINLEDKNLVLALEDLYSKNATSLKHPFFIALYLYQFGSHRGDFELLLQTDYTVWFKNSDYEIYLFALVLNKLKGSFYDELALNLYPLSDTITKTWLISVCSKRDKAEYLSMFKDILISENLELESWLPTLNSSLIRYIEASKNKAETSKLLEEMILLTKSALEKKKERNLDSSVLEKVLTRLELVKIVK